MIFRPRKLLFLSVATTALLVSAACSDGGDSGPTAEIFEAPPWEGAETYTYNLRTRGEDTAGTCTLETEPNVEPGRTRLVRLCSNAPYHDDGNVLVDSETLEPFVAERTVTDDEKGRQTVYTNTYRETDVLFEANVNGKPSETTRELPTPTDEAPEPGWYDDESLLWLARGIPLRDGWEGSYAHVINAGQPRVLTVDVKVNGTETIDIDGRQYATWKVEFRRENSLYRVWVEQEDTHRVIRAQIEDYFYDLQEGAPPVS